MRVARALLVIGAVLGTMLAVLTLANMTTTMAQTTAMPADQLVPSITVVGEGRVVARPDVAIAQIGVDTLASSLAEANIQANANMQRVINALKSAGITDKDIQTTHYGVNIERKFDQQTSAGEITGYRISNQVQVKFRDLGKVGTILDQVVTAGANNIYGLSFTVDDPTKLWAEARAAAVTAARTKAEDLAKLANVKLREVLHISELVGQPVPVVRMAARALGVEASPAPVETGELEFSVQIQVVYRI